MNELSHKFNLHETSLADSMAIINADHSLVPAKKSQWLCSLRRIADWIERPMDLIPARMTSLRHPVGRLNAARLGVTQKTLANHKSNVKAALNHLSGQGLLLSRGTPLKYPWDGLLANVTDQWAHKRLYSLFRYLSARGLQLDQVNDDVFNDFFEHRIQTTFLNVNPGHRRELARVWNACIKNVSGFPRKPLTMEPLKVRDNGPEWNDFPQTFRDEIETYLEGLKHPHCSASGRRRAGCKPSTLRTRRRELMAAARMAVSCGVPIRKFVGLGDLLNPETAGKVLDAYWARDGERPKAYVIDLAWKFLSVARDTSCLNDDELEQLDDMRYALEQHRRNGLTEKNLNVVRAVLSSDIWTKVIRLPDQLMADANRYRLRSPIKAAVLAELGVAIRILTYAPVRVGNLASISLDTNLIRPGGIDSPYWLVFPGYDVKNNADLDFPFDKNVSGFIEQYVKDYRPTLLRGSNQPWLFPGGRGNRQSKRASTLSDQITKRILKETGFRVTAHQFRHAAAALILERDPGNYELARRILGHRNIQTTIGFYVGLETMGASKQFGQMILQQHTHNDDKE